MPSMVQPHLLVLLLMPLAGLCCAAPGAETPEPPPTPAPTQAAGSSGVGRVVAIGDLHGDLERSLAVLRLAGLVDEQARWSGGEAVLVQTGDLLDRGDQGRETLDLLLRLQVEARAAGGRVEVLLGNHEAMNMLGDWRYVTPGDIEGYGGLEARKSALSLGGEHGAWLWRLPVAVQVGDTVFVHGGITPAMAEQGLDRLNAWFLAALEGEASPAVLQEQGPTWYRGYLQGGVTEVCPSLQRALASLGATRMVVGHTTQRSGEVAVRCQGALLGIDTGISAHYGAQLAALELRGGEDAWALYATGPEDLPDPP